MTKYFSIFYHSQMSDYQCGTSLCSFLNTKVDTHYSVHFSYWKDNTFHNLFLKGRCSLNVHWSQKVNPTHKFHYVEYTKFSVFNLTSLWWIFEFDFNNWSLNLKGEKNSKWIWIDVLFGYTFYLREIGWCYLSLWL